jgi:hypothetical protein
MPLGKSGGLPNCLRIQHNLQDRLGVWTSVVEPLHDAAGAPLWLEHPIHGSRVDVVGLPLTNIQGMALYPHSCNGAAGSGATELPLPMKWGPSDFVNVIGFPFGFSGGGGMGIWVQGAIATEPDLDYRDLPRFLIDSRTRSRQSGSPVVIYKRNGWVTRQGRAAIHAPQPGHPADWRVLRSADGRVRSRHGVEVVDNLSDRRERRPRHTGMKPCGERSNSALQLTSPSLTLGRSQLNARDVRRTEDAQL